MPGWPFNAGLPTHQRTEIQADGFSDPAPSCVYNCHRLQIARRLYEAAAL